MLKNFERSVLALAKAAMNAQQGSAPPPKPAEPSTRKPRVSRGRAMLLGAGLMLAGQSLVKSRGRLVLDSVRHGLAEKIDSNDEREFDAHDDDDFDEPPDAEGHEDFDDEPGGEEDQEDDEYYDEPEGEEDQVPDQEDDEDEAPARQGRRRKTASGRGRG